MILKDLGCIVFFEVRWREVEEESVRLLISGFFWGGRNLWSRVGWKWEIEVFKVRVRVRLGIIGRDIINWVIRRRKLVRILSF